MSNTAHPYVFGLRWETRCVIAFIVLTFSGIVTMLYADASATGLIRSSLIVLGTALAAVLRHFLRDDYLHTTSSTTLLALIPPISVATVYAGMLSSWMQRVGFGTVIRVTVTSLLLWGVVASAFPLTLPENLVTLVVSVATSVTRQITRPSRYLP